MCLDSIEHHEEKQLGKKDYGRDHGLLGAGGSEEKSWTKWSEGSGIPRMVWQITGKESLGKGPWRKDWIAGELEWDKRRKRGVSGGEPEQF